MNKLNKIQIITIEMVFIILLIFLFIVQELRSEIDSYIDMCENYYGKENYIFKSIECPLFTLGECYKCIPLEKKIGVQLIPIKEC